jgi:tRNA A37 methylthiotransferase MiaB
MVSLRTYVDSAAWICEANLVGTSTICRYLIENKHTIVTNPSDADVIVINSCGLTKMRRELSIAYFEKYYACKKPDTKIIMYGCLVKIDQQKIRSLNLIPIDFHEGEKFDEIFFNGIKFEDVHPHCDPTMKERLLEGKYLFQSTRIYPFILSAMLFPFAKKIRVNYHTMIDSITYKDKVFIEIARGCTGNCSYCMIKKARGPIRSRHIDEILHDIETLYDPTKNLFLVADDCGSYGLDIKTNVFELLYEINTKFPGISIDLNYLNPYWLEKYPEEYLRLFKTVHISLASIPVQSGSNRVIKKMNRRYDINTVANIIKKIKQVSPTTITYTHLLIGFPGENAIDFLRTLYHTKSFDLPVGLIYSEHEENTCLTEGNTAPAFIVTLRYLVFLSYTNLILSYKLLTYPRRDSHPPRYRVIDKK